MIVLSSKSSEILITTKSENFVALREVLLDLP